MGVPGPCSQGPRPPSAGSRTPPFRPEKLPSNSVSPARVGPGFRSATNFVPETAGVPMPPGSSPPDQPFPRAEVEALRSSPRRPPAGPCATHRGSARPLPAPTRARQNRISGPPASRLHGFRRAPWPALSPARPGYVGDGPNDPAARPLRRGVTGSWRNAPLEHASSSTGCRPAPTCCPPTKTRNCGASCPVDGAFATNPVPRTGGPALEAQELVEVGRRPCTKKAVLPNPCPPRPRFARASRVRLKKTTP